MDITKRKIVSVRRSGPIETVPVTDEKILRELKMLFNASTYYKMSYDDIFECMSIVKMFHVKRLGVRFIFIKRKDKTIQVIENCNGTCFGCFKPIKFIYDKYAVLDFIDNPTYLNGGKNLMGCSDNWYNPYYAISRTFTRDQIETMSIKEVDNLVLLACTIAEGLY